jgi:hypothetical protein
MAWCTFRIQPQDRQSVRPDPSNLAARARRRGLGASGPALRCETSHSWYPPACCGNMDCFPVACDQLVETVSGWLYVPTGNLFEREQVQPSQDHHCHVCLGHGGKSPLDLRVHRAKRVAGSPEFAVRYQGAVASSRLLKSGSHFRSGSARIMFALPISIAKTPTTGADVRTEVIQNDYNAEVQK